MMRYHYDVQQFRRITMDANVMPSNSCLPIFRISKRLTFARRWPSLQG
jgi:hypothetical protein